MTRPILCLDFDGVIHSYTSGWKGARNIPDPPVPGALDFILAAHARFTVAILSSRSHHWGGRRAMKRWLLKHAETYFATQEEDELRKRYQKSIDDNEAWFLDKVSARALVKSIRWPIFKPPAMITIDDRALTFTGEWPALDDLQSFKPWYRK